MVSIWYQLVSIGNNSFLPFLPHSNPLSPLIVAELPHLHFLCYASDEWNGSLFVGRPSQSITSRRRRHLYNHASSFCCSEKAADLKMKMMSVGHQGAAHYARQTSRIANQASYDGLLSQGTFCRVIPSLLPAFPSHSTLNTQHPSSVSVSIISIDASDHSSVHILAGREVNIIYYHCYTSHSLKMTTLKINYLKYISLESIQNNMEVMISLSDSTF